jgi:hypothetical protein
MGGVALIPTFSVTDTIVAPAPTAKLITFAIETAGDCSIGAFFVFLPNASWPEAFLPLSDVARGALRTSNDLIKMEVQWFEHAKCDMV